ncbi:protein piccolo isoform X1 [Pyrus x bretschneideri]|uniref:protein piccolo isoform X1 n=1 Tax=Pyrus x bretschneideri TaxID=225117 RepID=UPI002030FEA3|nr:protein piccolo isoform X1 [Pyrus x bretschneideri]
MDPPLNAELTQPLPPAVSIGEKRPIGNGEGDLGTQLHKKPRLGPNSGKDLRRVAEIVLALSTMAKIRGGKKPTEPEIGLMGEARSKLVELCEGLAPKDIVGRDAIGAVIEDLGLNAMLKEQRLGFRGPKLTIAEKFLQTKRKVRTQFFDLMEESKKFSALAQPATHPAHQFKKSFNAAAETHGMPHTVHMIPTSKPSHAPISSGGFPVTPSLVHVSTATPAPTQYQFPNNDVRASMVSSGFPSSHLGRDSTTPTGLRIERAQFRSDGGPNANASSYASQVQANLSSNHPLPSMNAPAWSVQTQSAKSGPEHKVPNHISVKVEGSTGMSMPQMTPVAAWNQNTKPFVSQLASGNLPVVHQPLQQMDFVKAHSLSNNHNDIAKIIQKLLQPQPPDHPTWIPPSRDYMSKALTCQSCQLTINEVDNVLICDACERGYHLMCAQSSNQRGIPRGEWHCMRCLSLSNGKPLPPKYGRVMRSNIQVKVPSNIAGVQTSSENKLGTLDPKVNQPKTTANGSSVLQNIAGIGGGASNHVESAPDLKILNAKESQVQNLTSSRKNMDEKPLSGSYLSSERSEERCSESKSEPPAEPKEITRSSRVEERHSESIAEPPAESKAECPAESKAEPPTEPKEITESFRVEERPTESKAEPPSESKEDLPAESKAEPLGEPKETTESSRVEERPSDSKAEPPVEPEETTESSRVEEIRFESKAEPSADFFNKGADKSDHSRPPSNTQVADSAGLPNCSEVPSMIFHDQNSALKNPETSHSVGNSGSSLRYDIKQDDQSGAQASTGESSVASGRALEHFRFCSDGLKVVEWIGNIVQGGDEKIYYHTCCIDGVTYQLQDHALFQSSHGKLIPLKLQSMWEDRKTGSKWAIVNRCYFPGDLPENVGRPSTPESNEVYQSNHDSTVMAGLIRGPCEVLSPAKFSGETERQSQLEQEANNELRPIFLCKWIYDEFKGVLEPVPE